MPKLVDKHDKTWPFIFHGVDLSTSGTGERTGDCPLCGRGGKFSVNEESGQWKCFVCGESGNVQTFVQKFWVSCITQTNDKSYRELADERGLLSPKSLQQWGVCQSSLTGRWIVPGYKVNENLGTLYVYTRVKGSKGFRNALLPTPTLGHHLFGIHLYESKRGTVYLCEGLWDCIALWELVKGEANVLAVPGCSVFEEIWLPLFSDKRVCLMYDSDHPKQHPKTGEDIPSAGFEATKRVASILMNSSSPPKELNYLKWGDLGYNQGLADGYDVRDFLRDI